MAFRGPGWRDSDTGTPDAGTLDGGVCMPFILFEHIFEYKGLL
jgi:hypothetical protein